MTNTEFKKVLGLGVPVGRDFILGLTMAVFQALSALALMGFSAWLISRASEMPPVMFLSMAIVGVRAFALGRAVFRYVERLLLHNSAFQLLSQLRPRVFAKLIPLAPSGLGANRADTVTRLVNDVDEVQNLSLRILSPLIQAVAVSLATLGFLWVTVPAAGFWVMGCIILAVFVALPVSNRLAIAANSNLATHRSILNQRTMNLIENLDVLDSFGWLQEHQKGIFQAQTQLTRTAKLQALSAGLSQSFFLILSTLATAGAAYFAAQQVTSGNLAGVMLAVFALIPVSLFDTLNALQTLPGIWRRYVAGTKRVNQIIDSQPDQLIAENIVGDEPDSFRNLHLEEVSARYPDASSMALQGFSLSLTAGQNLLITGPSGSGKSTIANVLVGFLNPVSGSYRIDGKDVRRIKTASLRRLVGYQEQSPTILQGTLRANLLLAKPEASDAQLWQVLERVKLASTFRQRQGLDTQLGERGHSISGGEAQRVALARSILANFKVVVFDEPTANVDPKTAQELIDDLLSIAKDDSSRASIFISHDPLFAGLADSTLAL